MKEFIERLSELMADARELELRFAEAKGCLVRDGERRVYGDCAVEAKPDPRLAALALLDAEQLAGKLTEASAELQRELSAAADAERERRRRRRPPLRAVS